MDIPPLLIAWHSRTGASEAMARTASDGAGHSALLLPVDEVQAEHMLAARGYLFVGPENLASLSGAMKEMFDRLYYPLLGQIEGRAYATIVAAGSDGEGAQRQIDRIATGWRLRRVSDQMIINFNAQTKQAILAAKRVPDDVLERCRDMGAALGEGLKLNLF